MDVDMNITSQNPLFVAPNLDSDQDILNALDDDCLRMIFEHLNTKDLTNVAEVCVRFKQQAKLAFLFTRRNVCIPNISDVSDLKLVAAMFRNFGQMIRALCIYTNFSDSKGKVFQLIEKCPALHLNELKLVRARIRDDMTISTIVGYVEKLILENCRLGNLNLLLTNPNLKVLHITGSWFNEKNINQQFVKLEEAYFYHININDADLCRFVQLNPTLKKLVIKDYDKGFGTLEFIPSVSRHLHSLVELEIDLFYIGFDESLRQHFQTRLPSLGQLASLKSLKINFNLLSIAPLMKVLARNNVPIEYLKIKDGKICSNAIEAILRLKELKTLEMDETFGMTMDLLVNGVEKLPLLQEVILRDEFHIIEPYVKELKCICLNLHLNEFDMGRRHAALKFVRNQPKNCQHGTSVMDGENSGKLSTANIHKFLLEKRKSYDETQRALEAIFGRVLNDS